jgi:hypothetical protein
MLRSKKSVKIPLHSVAGRRRSAALFTSIVRPYAVQAGMPAHTLKGEA